MTRRTPSQYLDRERGREHGLTQFLEEKPIKPGLQPCERPNEELKDHVCEKVLAAISPRRRDRYRRSRTTRVTIARP